MAYRIAFPATAACLLAAAVLPQTAAAADYYDGGRGPAVLQDRYGPEGDGGRFAPRREVVPDQRGPGPVVFDERDPDRRFGGGFRRPGPDAAWGYGPGRIVRPGFGYGPRFAGPPIDDGFDAPPPPRYRAVVAPLYGEAFEAGAGRPDAGCIVEEAQSTTPAGWRKTVTHRTCYRR